MHDIGETATGAAVGRVRAATVFVGDLERARRFYLDVLGCRAGRSGSDWLDLDFFGNQLVAHVSDSGALARAGSNFIDGHEVPLPHFGAVLGMVEWRAMAARLEDVGVAFIVEPHVRYEGRPHEQASMIFADPGGNVIELKAMADPKRLFTSSESKPSKTG